MDNRGVDWWNYGPNHDPSYNYGEMRVPDDKRVNYYELPKNECFVRRTSLTESFKSSSNDFKFERSFSHPTKTPRLNRSMYVVPHRRVLEKELKNDDLPSWDAEFSSKSVDVKNNNLPQDSVGHKNSKEVSELSKTLKSEAGLSKSLEKESMGTIIERILELSNKHMNENFKKKINEIYSLLYGDDLPEEWLDNLKFSVIIDQNDDKPNNSNDNISTNYNVLTSVESKNVLTNLKLSNNTHKTDESIHKNLNSTFNKLVLNVSNFERLDQNIVGALKPKITEKNQIHNLNTLTSVKSKNLIANESTKESFSLKPNIDQESKKDNLSDKLMESIMSPKNLNLENLGKEFKVIIQSCKSSAEVWGIVDDEDYSDQLQELQNEMAVFYVTVESIIKSIKENSFYAVYDDKSWHRVKCLKINGAIAVVLFIDRGDVGNYTVENLFKLDFKFCSLPAQAFKMTLSSLEMFYECEDMNNIIQKYLLKKIFYAKLDKYVEKRCLSVKLYQHKDSSVSINDIIKREACKQSLTRRLSAKPENEKFSLQNSSCLSAEAAPFVPEGEKVPETAKDTNPVVVNKKEQIKESVEKKTTQVPAEIKNCDLKSNIKLYHPKVPKNEYFDVFVVETRDPTNFVVQMLPEKTLNLKKMSNELASWCEAYEGPKFDRKSVSEGQLYACKSSKNDLQWYRVFLTKIIDEKVCSVYFCDYGRKKDINIESLRPLPEQFHELPYQAVHAKVYGIKPKFGEWSKPDCDRFKDLAEKRTLVALARVKNVVPKNQPSVIDVVYEMELIDTSTNDDVYISKILLSEGRAVKK